MIPKEEQQFTEDQKPDVIRADDTHGIKDAGPSQLGFPAQPTNCSPPWRELLHRILDRRAVDSLAVVPHVDINAVAINAAAALTGNSQAIADR